MLRSQAEYRFYLVGRGPGGVGVEAAVDPSSRDGHYQSGESVGQAYDALEARRPAPWGQHYRLDTRHVPWKEEVDWYSVRPDECDQCCSEDVAYPYTTLGYLCTNCRSAYKGSFKNIT